MSKEMSPAKRFGSKLKAIKETLESEGKTPMKTQRMVDRIMSKKKADYEKKKYLTGGQAKIAAKAPPTNKIDAKDFAVLRAEKAKGRGMGLQDEKVKPGKVMKARVGKSVKGTTAKSAMGKTFSGYQKVFKTGVSAGQKASGTSTIVGVKPTLPEAAKSSKVARRALKAAQATRLGKIVLPIAAAGVAAQQYLKSKMKKKDEPKKKMGGGMMMKPMGYKEGSPRPSQQARSKSRRTMAGVAGAGLGALGGSKKDVKPKLKVVIVPSSKNSLTGQGGLERDAKNKPYRYSYSTDPMLKNATIIKSSSRMGGGMMNKPMGYKAGKSVKAKCKLGKNKPTKMY